jgi:hypothetical protein
MAEAIDLWKGVFLIDIWGQKLLTLNLTFLYVTDSTLKPTVGIVVTD